MGDQTLCSFTFWGVRGSTPCADQEYMAFGGNTTCLQLHIPSSEELVILDSGTGIRKLGEKFSKQNEELSGRVFITHPHRDHIQGFPFFRPLYSGGNHFTVHMPKQGQESCRDIFSQHHSEIFFPVSLDMMNAQLKFIDQPSQKISYDGYEVEFLKANHSTNTAIYKFHLEGKQLVFAPDNELVPANYDRDKEHMQRISEFFGDVDVLVHDAQYDSESYSSKHGWGHSPWQQVIQMAREAGIGKLFLTHHDPGSNDEKLQQLDEQIRVDYGAYFETIALAKEGQTFLV